jgi:hypothetical protein
VKRPTAASLKKVTPENLATLGAERLAELLVAAALHRPELKRRLRMELAAEQGADHLLTEIDKRLGSLETSRSKVSWRQRPTFLRDLEGLRVLIGQRLAGLDPAAALDRMWRFMNVAGRLAARVRDREGELAAVFTRAAGDIGRLLEASGAAGGAEALVEAVVADPVRWTGWLPKVLERSPPGLARTTLVTMSRRENPVAGWMPPLRLLADAAEDVDAYRATFPVRTLGTPAIAAEVARRLLAADRIEEAGEALQAAAPNSPQSPRAATPSGDMVFAWETVWIDYLVQSGQNEAAQTARWSSFMRTLAPERLRAFTRELADFDDVEAEQRAFQHVAAHPNLGRAVQFLMDWPALPVAAALIVSRGGESGTSLEPHAEAWAERLRARQPKAASLLLLMAAKAAYRREDRDTGERLTREAETLAIA